MDGASDIIVLVTDQLDLTKWVALDRLLIRITESKAKLVFIALNAKKYGLISLECREWEIHITEWEEELDGPFYVADDDRRGSVENLGADDDVI